MLFTPYHGPTQTAPGVYILNGDLSAADVVGAWIDTDCLPELSWQFVWSAVAATNAQCAFEVTNDPAKAAANVTRILGTAIATWYGVANGTLGAVAGNSSIVTANSWRFIRGLVVRTAGGGANQIQAFVHGRGGGA
jgi:hypothetical protein